MNNNAFNWGKVSGIGSCINAVIAATTFILRYATKNYLDIFKIVFFVSLICLCICLIVFFNNKRRKEELPALPEPESKPKPKPTPIITKIEEYNKDGNLYVEGNIFDNRYVKLTIYNKTSSTKMQNFEVKILQNEYNDNQTGYLPFVVGKKVMKKEIDYGRSIVAEIDWNYYKKGFTVDFTWETLAIDGLSKNENTFAISFKVVSNQLSV